MKIEAITKAELPTSNIHVRLWLAMCLACLMALLAIHPLWAADFEVDSELDGVDSNLVDGICLNETVIAGGACTLRAAIQQANASAGPDTIHLPNGTYILTLENSFDNAEDAAATGDLDITSNMIIEGSGARTTTIQAHADLHDRVFELIGEEAVAAFNRLTVTNGDTTALTGDTQDGGGIRNGGGRLEGFELVVSNNRSPSFGGGIYTVGTTSTFLNRCAINGNKAEGDGAHGGGIYLGQNHSMTLANCTISDNEADERGGGINIANNSKVTSLINTTVANNRLVGNSIRGGGLYIGNSTDVFLASSIIADNFIQGGEDNDCYGDIDLLDFSLVEVPAPNDECRIAGDGESNSSLFGSEDPLLGPLMHNGSDLQTHALLEGSIAIDAGSQLEAGSGGTACYDSDARGQARPARAFCDMGAYELQQLLFMPKLDKE